MTMMSRYNSRNKEKLLTKSDPECRSRVVKVILDLVIDKAKGCDQQMEKNPYAKEKLAASLVDHPQVELAHGCFRFGWGRGK